MASIQEYLDLIKNAIYGKDVRQAIHDGIQQCYYDGKAGSTDLEARQRLDSAEGSISSLGSRMSTAEGDIDTLDARVDQIVAPSGEAPSAAEVADGRIVGGVTYDLIGDAIRAVNDDLVSVDSALEMYEYNGSANVLDTSSVIGKTLQSTEVSSYTSVFPLDWSNGALYGDYKLTLVFDNNGEDYTPTGSFQFKRLDENGNVWGDSYDIATATSTGIALNPSIHKALQVVAYTANTLTVKKMGLTIGDYEQYFRVRRYTTLDTLINSITRKSANVYEDDLTNGYVTVETGAFVSGSTTKVTDYLPTIGGKYLVSAFENAKNQMFLLACFDSEKNIIADTTQHTGDGSQRTTGYFKLPDNCAYIRATFVNANVHSENKLYLLDEVSYDPSNKNVNYLILDNGAEVPFIDIASKDKVNQLIQASNAKSKRFYGDKIVAFGDSVTNGGAWFSGVASFFGSTPINCGVAGASVTTNGHDAFCSDARINTIPLDADLVLVMGGINDWNGNVALGEKKVTNTDTTTFYGAINVMLQKMMARVPSATIICMGATYGMYPNNTAFSDSTGIYNDLGFSTIDYGRAFADMCKLNGIESFVVGEDCGWNANNISTYVGFDGAYLHPNSTGGARMASVINRKIG